jgi:hypothetical protein
MTQVTYALKYGLVAQVLAGDDDRAPYVPSTAGDYQTRPPPLKPPTYAQHHPACPCGECAPQAGTTR